MRLDFAITRWAAWAPGLHPDDDWRRWAAAPWAPTGDELPPLVEVPALARRRIERLGRLAYQVAQGVEGDARGLPLVFASRHGDANRSVGLLQALARGEPLSPTSFALSVHNAIAGQYSITRQDTAPVSCVANGRFTAEAGLVEAMTLLSDGHEEALLVVYDAALDPAYALFNDEAPADFAWAWRVRRGQALSLETAEASPTPAPPWPHGLEVLRWYLRGEPSLAVGDGLAGWRWSRHG